MNEIAKFEGIGIHTGRHCKVSIFNCHTQSGIHFIDTENPEILIPATLDHVISTDRNTTIGCKGIEIQTIEHLMAALAFTGIHNAFVSVTGGEIPIMDGSASPFVKALQKESIFSVNEGQRFKIKNTVHYLDAETGASYSAKPAKNTEIACIIHYPKSIGKQDFLLNNIADFSLEIAPARTFCEIDEILILAENNKIRGGNLNNALILNSKTPEPDLLKKIANKMGLNIVLLQNLLRQNLESKRFENEPVRHKILDILGDFYLLGGLIHGAFEIEKPGHASNIRFLKFLIQNNLLIPDQSQDLKKSTSLHQ